MNSKSNKINEKERRFYWIKEINPEHKTENWQIFLKNLQEFIKNNVKEYFLR